jgi:hypothetical protein
MILNITVAGLLLVNIVILSLIIREVVLSHRIFHRPMSDGLSLSDLSRSVEGDR